MSQSPPVDALNEPDRTPLLIGSDEVGRLIGQTPKWVREQALRPRGLPLPLPPSVRIGRRRYWHREDIEAWARAAVGGGA